MSVEDGRSWDDDDVAPRDPHDEDTGLRRQFPLKSSLTTEKIKKLGEVVLQSITGKTHN